MLLAVSMHQGIMGAVMAALAKGRLIPEAALASSSWRRHLSSSEALSMLPLPCRKAATCCTLYKNAAQPCWGYVVEISLACSYAHSAHEAVGQPDQSRLSGVVCTGLLRPCAGSPDQRVLLLLAALSESLGLAIQAAVAAIFIRVDVAAAEAGMGLNCSCRPLGP